MTNEEYITLTPGERGKIERAQDLLRMALVDRNPTKVLTLIQEAEDTLRWVSRSAFWRPF